MAEATSQERLSRNDNQILLGLLDSVERDGETSQRRLAADLGVAVGLVNAYIKRCVKMGLIKASQAPARRYAYYLTPQGFVEKSRLTVEYLSYSFSFFRQARSDCSNLLRAAYSQGISSVVLSGVSDLAEIAVLCALDAGVQVVAIVDPDATVARYVGVHVFTDFALVDKPFDAVVITNLKQAAESTAAALAHFSADRVLIPQLLSIRSSTKHGDEARDG